MQGVFDSSVHVEPSKGCFLTPTLSIPLSFSGVFEGFTGWTVTYLKTGKGNATRPEAVKTGAGISATVSSQKI